MPETSLIDPAFLVPPDSSESTQWQEFWLNIIRWELDRRIRIGTATFQLALHYDLYRLAEQKSVDWPPCTRLERRKALAKLLSRVLGNELSQGSRTLAPEYIGPSPAYNALLQDLPTACASSESSVALATAACWWTELGDGAECIPPPPREIERYFVANADLRSHRARLGEKPAR